MRNNMADPKLTHFGFKRSPDIIKGLHIIPTASLFSPLEIISDVKLRAGGLFSFRQAPGRPNYLTGSAPGV